MPRKRFGSGLAFADEWTPHECRRTPCGVGTRAEQRSDPRVRSSRGERDRRSFVQAPRSDRRARGLASRLESTRYGCPAAPNTVSGAVDIAQASTQRSRRRMSCRIRGDPSRQRTGFVLFAARQMHYSAFEHSTMRSRSFFLASAVARIACAPGANARCVEARCRITPSRRAASCPCPGGSAGRSGRCTTVA
jgi:hypothetical protein